MLQNSQLPFRVERLSGAEIWLLRRRMIGVWIIGICIGASTAYFLFSDFIEDSKGMKIPLMIFAVFFYAILGLIIFSHTKNAFRNEKKVYEGQIADKKTESSSKMGRSASNEQYLISLDGHWFRVDLKHFKQVQIGDMVEVIVLGKGQVFKIDKIQSAQEVFLETPDIRTQTNLYTVFSGFSEQFTEAEKSILKSHIRKAVFYRTIIGFLSAWLLFALLKALAVIFSLEKSSGITSYLYIHYLILALLVIVFMVVNRKTWLLILDLRSGKKEIIVERIIDKIQSDHLKPSPNSMIATKNTSNYKFYYLQTENLWLRANEETFEASSPGKNLIIQRGMHSHVILNFGF